MKPKSVIKRIKKEKKKKEREEEEEEEEMEISSRPRPRQIQAGDTGCGRAPRPKSHRARDPVLLV